MSGPGDERPPDERGRPYPAEPYPPGPYPPGPQPPGPQPPGPQYGQQPPHADPQAATPAEPPYVYNPYGNFTYPSSYPSPAGLGPDAERPPPARPGSMHLALLLAVVSALPYLLIGLVAAAGAGQAAAALPPDDLAQIQQLGIDVEQVVRTTGIVIAAVAAVYVLLAVIAWTGRRWARALLAATTVGFVLMVAASVLAAGSQGLALDGGSVLILVVPIVIALAGVGLMFSGAARDWFARRR